MRRLIVIVLVLVGLWGGYWVVGSRAVERGFAAWFEARRADGWVADYTGLNTAGFPNRFDTTFTGLELADPHSGLDWSAPFFQVFALSYKPQHIIAVWPDTQTIATPDEKIAVTAGDMRGSLVFQAGPSLVLDHSSILMENLGLVSDAGWTSALGHGQLAARLTEGAVNTYDVYFEARDITPASELLKALDDIAGLTNTIAGVSIDSEIAFDAPWDRYAVERARPQITRLKLKLLKADWGELDLWMAGTLDVDTNGVPSGQITVKAKNWREMIALAVQLGYLPEGFAGTLADGLGLVAQLSGDPKTLDVPLTFANGNISLGPVPLGPAPRLILR